MSDTKSSPPFIRRIGPLMGFILLMLATHVLRDYWIRHHENKINGQVLRLSKMLEDSIASMKPILDEDLQALLSSYPDVVFMAFHNQLDQSKRAFINGVGFGSNSNVHQFFNEHTREETMHRILETPGEFSQPYLRIDNKDLHQMIQNQKVKIGKLIIGFNVPGYLKGFPNMGTYFEGIYKGWILFLVSNALLYPFLLRRRRKEDPVETEPASAEVEPTKKDQLEWLEKKMDISIDDTRTRDTFLSDIGWTELFNQSDLKDWLYQGDWYVKERAAIGFPWGSSMITRYEIPYQKYEYEVEAQRMVGREGFAILFRADNQQYVWMVGGWKNTRSEVVGYPSTINHEKIEKFRWYHLKVECDAENLSGYLDGKKVWQIQRNAQPEKAQVVHFQEGFGVGVWSSISRFGRIRIVSAE